MGEIVGMLGIDTAASGWLDEAVVFWESIAVE